MRLTDEQSKKIDEALKALGLSLKDELDAVLDPSKTKIDDAFLKTIKDSYLSSGEGLIGLLLDSGVLAQPRCGGFQGCQPEQNCTCGATCAQPQEAICNGHWTR